MTAEAYHHYDDLHQLVDQLSPKQADAVRAVVVQLVTAAGSPRSDDESDTSLRRHFSFAGSISAEPDFTERSEEILDEMVRRNAG